MIEVACLLQEGDGHHSDFNRLFAAAAEDIGISMRFVQSPADADKHGKMPLFYPMLDRSPALTMQALARVAFRSLKGQITVGLFFRPSSCFVPGSIKYAVRRVLFQIVSRLPHASILSLVPFGIYPEAAQVSTDYIYDPQLWDLRYLGVPNAENSDLVRELEKKAAGRKIIISLGAQNRSKGFNYFSEIWRASPALRQEFYFVAAGKIAKESRAHADAFAQAEGFLIDRRIEDAELFALYRVACAAWSCYAPDYNQSSGIHGRAVQLGVPVIVRRGAFLEKLGPMLSHPTAAIPFDDTEAATSCLLSWSPRKLDPSAQEKIVGEMRNHSLQVLRKAFGTD